MPPQRLAAGPLSVHRLNCSFSYPLNIIWHVLSYIQIPPLVSADALRELAWSGVPPDMRPQCWRLLLGYAPPNSDRRQAVLTRKRQEYRDCVPQYYDIPNTERSEDEVNTLRQVSRFLSRGSCQCPSRLVAQCLCLFGVCEMAGRPSKGFEGAAYMRPRTTTVALWSFDFPNKFVFALALDWGVLLSPPSEPCSRSFSW
jgi:hypothetical protein